MDKTIKAMKYFYDTEFLEGTQKSFFGQSKPTIDLISVGIVCEDGREYYAISKDFNLKEAWNRYDIKTQQVYGDMRNHFPEGKKTKVYWIRENVLKPIFDELLERFSKESKELLNTRNYIGCIVNQEFSFKLLKWLIKRYGKTNKQIAEDIVFHCGAATIASDMGHLIKRDSPIFYGYYSAYDHVALCWLFGKMIDLPKGFPYLTYDIQQLIDEHNINKNDLMKEIPQTGCHNSLKDALWNMKAYNWIINKTL